MQFLMRIMTFELLNLLVCQASTSFMQMRLRSCSFSLDNFIRKLGDSFFFTRLACINVDLKSRETTFVPESKIFTCTF